MSELKLKLKLDNSSDSTERQVTEQNPEVPEISVSTNTSEIQSNDLSDTQLSETELTTPLEKEQNEDTSDASLKQNNESEIIPQETTKKIDISSIKTGTSHVANSNTVSQEDIEEDNEEKEIPTQNSKEQEKIFGNYESSFERRGQKFMDRIRNLHATPKTRLGFLIMIISITMGVIGGLMILVPEKHSLSIYKASVLEIYNTKVEGESAGNGDTVIETPPTPIIVPTPVKEEEKIVPKEEISKRKVKEYILENYRRSKLQK